MKTRKNIITILTLCAALSLTACSGKDTTEKNPKKNESTTSDTKESTDASTKKLDDLYQQENQIFADHSEVWDKVFGMMSKTNTDSDSAYADFLTATIEENKSSFTEAAAAASRMPLKNTGINLHLPTGLTFISAG